MSNGKFPVLIFANSGYCEKLDCSYYQGRFEARSKEEYEALKEFAVEELGGNAIDVEMPLNKMTVPVLREIAKELEIPNYAKPIKKDLIPLIEAKRAELIAKANEEDEDEEEADKGAGDDMDNQEDDINLESGE